MKNLQNMKMYIYKYKNAVTTGSKKLHNNCRYRIAENPLLDVSGMDNKGDDFLLIPLETAENGDEGFISDISEYCSDSSAGTTILIIRILPNQQYMKLMTCRMTLILHQ